MSDFAPQVPNMLTGRCMCGAVTYKITEWPMADGLCHCNRCRQQSGTAFSTVIFTPQRFDDHRRDGGLRRHRNERTASVAPLLPTLRFATDHRADLTPELFMIKAGTLDSNEWFRPVWELFVGRRRPWLSPVPGAKQFDGNPDI